MTTPPSIGRIVHYVSYGTPGGEYGSACRAAVVTQTRESGVIGLAVLSPGGLHFDKEIGQSEMEHTGGTWHYPCALKESE